MDMIKTSHNKTVGASLLIVIYEVDFLLNAIPCHFMQKLLQVSIPPLEGMLCQFQSKVNQPLMHIVVIKI